MCVLKCVFIFSVQQWVANCCSVLQCIAAYVLIDVRTNILVITLHSACPKKKQSCAAKTNLLSIYCDMILKIMLLNTE